MSESGSSEPRGPHQLEAFVDSLGVVIARIITMIALGSAMSAPFFLVVVIFAHLNFEVAAFFCAYTFLWCSAMVVLIYILRAIGKTQNNFFAELNGFQSALFFTITAPAIPLLFSIMPAHLVSQKTADKTFITKPEFDLILFFYLSFVSFVLTVFCVGGASELSGRYFTGAEHVGIAEAVGFSFEILIKGILFDVFEHFGLSISFVEQSKDLAGLMFSFVIRITSSALVIAIIVELFNSTRRRMASHG